MPICISMLACGLWDQPFCLILKIFFFLYEISPSSCIYNTLKDTSSGHDVIKIQLMANKTERSLKFKFECTIIINHKKWQYLLWRYNFSPSYRAYFWLHFFYKAGILQNRVFAVQNVCIYHFTPLGVFVVFCRSPYKLFL